MKGLLRNVALAVVLGLMAAFIVSGVALAHESKTVGDYKIILGVSPEPAYSGERSTIEFGVTDTKGTTDTADDTPVLGLTTGPALEVRVSQGALVKEAADFRSYYGRDGWYKADVFVTKPGTYNIHLEGSINGTAIHEHWEKEFADIATMYTETPVDVAGQALTAANSAQSSADSAKTVAIVGIALGAVGIVGGAAALVLRRK